ncbi:hypothetical protein N8762_00070 [Candidatus Marinamargulisbacteria bacterium]|nr:hypothetical protein [Candidatus Marinamargulisbacteria bacterium]
MTGSGFPASLGGTACLELLLEAGGFFFAPRTVGADFGLSDAGLAEFVVTVIYIPSVFLISLK